MVRKGVVIVGGLAMMSGIVFTVSAVSTAAVGYCVYKNVKSLVGSVADVLMT